MQRGASYYDNEFPSTGGIQIHFREYHMGKKKNVCRRRASIGFKHFLGYERGPDGEFIINEEQAVTVRYIYKRYLEGYSTYKIACELT